MSEEHCHREQIAAYVDGELDRAELASFEQHLHDCATCRAELNEHRRFTCELDAAITDPPAIEAPPGFARMIRVQAESDMSGLRSLAEHKRALSFAVVLSLFIFALLGTSTSALVISNGSDVVSTVFDLGRLLAKTAFDTASSVAVVFRVLGRSLIIESGSAGWIVVLIGLAALLLSRLMIEDRRARTTD